jgi:hypothetical protein
MIISSLAEGAASFLPLSLLAPTLIIGGQRNLHNTRSQEWSDYTTLVE